MLDVTIYDAEGQEVIRFEDVDAVDYVSLVNNQTYGPPALVAPQRGRDASGRDQPPTAQIEDEVLYINTNLIPLFKIVRLHER